MRAGIPPLVHVPVRDTQVTVSLVATSPSRCVGLSVGLYRSTTSTRRRHSEGTVFDEGADIFENDLVVGVGKNVRACCTCIEVQDNVKVGPGPFCGNRKNVHTRGVIR